jgi:hypothetical protein
MVDDYAKFRVRCAWHPKFFGEEKIMREAAPGHESDPPSDGICPECLKILFAKGDIPQNRSGRTT